MQPAPEDILNFWFIEVGPNRWFDADPALDQAICANFLETHEMVLRGDLKKWEDTPESVLALLLLLQIFPRRMFRNTARAYATDDDAVDLARLSIIRHFDDRIDAEFKLFFYMPFTYSEHLSDQRLALFYIRERNKNPSWLDEAEFRLQIIQKFGRFPQRNAVLGRESTPEETAFLERAKDSVLSL